MVSDEAQGRKSGVGRVHGGDPEGSPRRCHHGRDEKAPSLLSEGEMGSYAVTDAV